MLLTGRAVIPSRIRWLYERAQRQIWYRTTLLSILGVAGSFIAVAIRRYVPIDISASIGTDAIDRILDIIAASMLSVAIFSLNTLVSAITAASSNVTPRASRLLIEDRSAHNALGTFTGAFLYALVGIIALRTGLYGDGGRVVLLIVTIPVIVLIVGTMLSWIGYASRLARVSDIAGKVERAATDALRTRHQHPYLDGTPLIAPLDSIPEHAAAILAHQIGYIQFIDVESLQRVAERHDLQIRVPSLPGTFIDSSRPLAVVFGMFDDATESKIRAAFEIDGERSFEQDPRYGICVLSEIAQRALSPGINDPGTAIDILGRMARLLAIWSEPAPPEADHQPRFPRIHVPSLAVDDLFDDAFFAIARDGASQFEVAIRLQKILRGLAMIDDYRFCQAAKRHSESALERAKRALDLDRERDAIASCAKSIAELPIPSTRR